MKNKIIYASCIFVIIVVLLGLMKRDRMFSSNVILLSRDGIVESIDTNSLVVRLDKLNEPDEDFKNIETLQLDCTNCSYRLKDLKEGTKITFDYFPYNADVQPLKVEDIVVIYE